MFTGIITDIGTLRTVTYAGPADTEKDVRFEIITRFAMADLQPGASVACAGVCLTVIESGIFSKADVALDPNDPNSDLKPQTRWFAVNVSRATLGVTTLGDWKPGLQFNLEAALRLGDPMGGHVVSGHVDGIARLVTRNIEGASERWIIAIPHDYGPFMVAKGSVVLDGVSLTINHVKPLGTETKETLISVNIIAHTRTHTCFSQCQPGSLFNFEIDLFARYIARLAGYEHTALFRAHSDSIEVFTSGAGIVL